MEIFLLFFKKIFVFTIIFGLGVGIIIYRLKLVEIIGKIDWFENNIGVGSTYTFWALVGVLICFYAFMYLFGMVNLFNV